MPGRHREGRESRRLSGWALLAPRSGSRLSDHAACLLLGRPKARLEVGGLVALVVLRDREHARSLVALQVALHRQERAGLESERRLLAAPDLDLWKP